MRSQTGSYVGEASKKCDGLSPHHPKYSRELALALMRSASSDTFRPYFLSVYLTRLIGEILPRTKLGATDRAPHGFYRTFHSCVDLVNDTDKIAKLLAHDTKSAGYPRGKFRATIKLLSDDSFVVKVVPTRGVGRILRWRVPHHKFSSSTPGK